MSERVVVVGAGTMGHGIAQVAAMAGYDVTLVDTDAAVLQHGIQRIAANLDDGVRRGKVTPEQRNAAVARVRPAASIGDAANGDAALGDAASIGDAADGPGTAGRRDSIVIAVEAVPERMDLKQSVFAELERCMPAHTILATNTSSLSVTTLQRATTSGARVIGTHFFNPVHINKLLEIVRGADTSQATLDATVAFATRIGKDPVVVNDSPGFATSRLGVLLGLEAIRMVESGVARAADIDKAMVLGYRHPMGPLELTDLVGLDVRLDIARYLHAELKSDAFRPPPLLERMVAEGRLGRKSGQGFYDWTER